MKRKDKLKLLAERFGGCGCKEHCALEADKYGVKIPKKPEEE